MGARHSVQLEYVGDASALVVFGAVRVDGVVQAQNGRPQVRRMDRRIDVQTGWGVRDRARVSDRDEEDGGRLPAARRSFLVPDSVLAEKDLLRTATGRRRKLRIRGRIARQSRFDAPANIGGDFEDFCRGANLLTRQLPQGHDQRCKPF